MRLDVLLRVECLAERRIENVARVRAAFVLQKRDWKLPTPVIVRFTEVPVEVLEVEQLLDALDGHGVALLDNFIGDWFDSDERGIQELHAVVDQ